MDDLDWTDVEAKHAESDNTNKDGLDIYSYRYNASSYRSQCAVRAIKGKLTLVFLTWDDGVVFEPPTNLQFKPYRDTRIRSPVIDQSKLPKDESDPTLWEAKIYELPLVDYCGFPAYHFHASVVPKKDKTPKFFQQSDMYSCDLPHPAYRKLVPSAWDAQNLWKCIIFHESYNGRPHDLKVAESKDGEREQGYKIWAPTPKGYEPSMLTMKGPRFQFCSKGHFTFAIQARPDDPERQDPRVRYVSLGTDPSSWELREYDGNATITDRLGQAGEFKLAWNFPVTFRVDIARDGLVNLDIECRDKFDLHEWPDGTHDFVLTRKVSDDSGPVVHKMKGRLYAPIEAKP